MVEARQRAAWSHTAALLATIININRAKGTQPVKADSLNPYIRGGSEQVMVISREEAQEVFRQIAEKGRSN